MWLKLEMDKWTTFNKCVAFVDPDMASLALANHFKYCNAITDDLLDVQKPTVSSFLCSKHLNWEELELDEIDVMESFKKK